MDTFTRETNRKGGGIKILPARRSGRRLKKPGAMLQRILSIGEVLELGPSRVISHKILIFNTVRVSRNNLYYERPVYIASFVAYLAQSAGKGQKPYQNRVFVLTLLFTGSY